MKRVTEERSKQILAEIEGEDMISFTNEVVKRVRKWPLFHQVTFLSFLADAFASENASAGAILEAANRLRAVSDDDVMPWNAN